VARKLAVVTSETPGPARPKNIKAAVEMGERDLLVAMRTKVASEIDAGVPAHALAPLMRQLRELDKDIRALDARAAEEGEHGPVEDEAFDASAI
jgi:hypothetical protein